MKTFNPRSPRYELRFPVEFIAGGKIISGECINLSDSGLLATFERPLELWSGGDIRLHTGQRSRRVSVRVSRADGLNAGMVFLHESESDRHFIATMIEDLIAERRREGKDVTPPF